MKIAIMTDVNAGLDYVGYDTGIICLRSSINFPNEKPLVDGVDIKADEFYERIKNVHDSKDIPSTSAPSVADIYAELDKLVEEGYTDVIHLPISFKLSSTGQTVRKIGEEYKGKINVHVIDTKAATYIQGYMATTAKKMADEGASVDEIIKHVKYLIDHNQSYFVVDDLGYLVKNGRLSNVKGFLGTLFKIKPILEIDKTGSIKSLMKVRTYQKAVDTLIDLILKYIEKSSNVQLFAFHSIKQETIEYVIDQIKEKRPDITNIPIHYITPAVGAHIGCGVVGICAFLLK